MALVLVGIEAIAVVADRRWSFRARLLAAFAVATRGEHDGEAQWADPQRAFASPDSSSRTLRFRLAGSSDPIGEAIEPSRLPSGRRVIVLGESAAFGVGVRSEETFAALLDDALRARGTRVLNAGQVGANPWEVMEAGAQVLARYAPSTLVLFTGNNVWIDWTPPQQARWNPWALDVLSTLATSRAIAGLEFLALRWTLRHTPRDWRVEQLGRLASWVGRLWREPRATFLDHQELAGSGYALEHPLDADERFGATDWARVRALHLQRFEASLVALVEHAAARDVGVVLVTLPFNHRLSPAWNHPQFEAVDPVHRDEVRGLLRQAGALVQAGDCGQALPIVQRALALDPHPPLLHYLRAQCLERTGDLDGAEDAYAESRERMIGNLGSRLSVNETIRRVARRFDVPLVDAVRVFDDHAHAAGRHFNEGLIIDDCHPSPSGHRLIASALAPLL